MCFFKTFLQLGKEERKVQVPLTCTPCKPWGLGSSIAFGTVECQGGWLTTNEAESSPLGKPGDLSAGCPVPTDGNGIPILYHFFGREE